MEKRIRIMTIAAVLMAFGFPGISNAFDGSEGRTGLFGDLNTYGLTKEDLRGNKPQSETGRIHEAVETGELKTGIEEPSSQPINGGGLNYRPEDVGP